jgi:hypothetical protein
MHITLNEKDNISQFDLRNGVLNIRYGKKGKVAGRVTAYEIGETNPCVVGLIGSNFSVTIYSKSLQAFFENEEAITLYLEQNVNFEQVGSLGKENIVIDNLNFTDSDMEVLRKQLEDISGVPLV